MLRFLLIINLRCEPEIKELTSRQIRKQELPRPAVQSAKVRPLLTQGHLTWQSADWQFTLIKSDRTTRRIPLQNCPQENKTNTELKKF